MACNNIKLYNYNHEEVDAGLLDVNEEYIAEVTIPDGQEFVGWVDSYGNDINSYLTPIPTPEGMDETKLYYKFSPKCGLVYKAVFKVGTQYICNVIVVSNNERQGSALITQDIPEGESYLGQTITIEAVPECCYEFTKWVDRNGSYITINPYQTPELGYGTNSYVAFFELESFNFTVDWQNDEGGVSIYADGVRVETKTFHVFCGSVVHVDAEPNPLHRFSRWIDGNGNTISTNSSLDYVIACGDIDSSIRCEFTAADTVTIVYHNGAENDIIDSRIYSTNDDFITFPAEIDREGFQIEGMRIEKWTTSLDSSEAVYYDVNTQYPTPTTDILDLYAVWIPIYTITIPLNPRLPIPLNPIVGFPGRVILLPDLTPYAEEGMKFLGWSTNIYSQNNLLNAQGIKGSFVIPNETVTLNAVWVPDSMQTYDVAYYFNDGTPTSPNTIETVVNNAYIIRGVDFFEWERAHYQFTTWDNIDNPGTYYQPGQQCYLSNNTTLSLKAQWEEESKWTVTYHFDSTTDTLEVYDGTIITLNDGSTLSREGYVAVGWKDSDDEVNYNTYLFGGDIVVRSDMEFWPIWSSENCFVYISSPDPQGVIVIDGQIMAGTGPFEIDLYTVNSIDGQWVGGSKVFSGWFIDLETHELVHGILHLNYTVIFALECGKSYEMVFEEVEPEQCIVHLNWDGDLLDVNVGGLGVIPPYDLDLNEYSEIEVIYTGSGQDSYNGKYYDTTAHEESYLWQGGGDFNTYSFPLNSCQRMGGHDITLLTENSPIPQ